jgi:signal transduction histidine kinase
VPAWADGKLVGIALTQLVDNALKYSVPRTPILMEVARVSEKVGLSVQNQGGIIAPADRERIFERFYRTAEARRGPVGTGLGLSIAKRIVDAHNGYIDVQSSSEAGTSFTVTLPVAQKE